MTDLPEKIEYELGIYQLETTDPVMAGPEGIDNLQAKQLANRTAWLKQQSTAMIESAGLTPDASSLEQLTAAVEILARRSAWIVGEVRMYTGEVIGIPSGWLVCDGTNGTPNLTDRFIIGGDLNDIGKTGGAARATTSSNGEHSHSVSVTVSARTLSVSQIPSHTHSSDGDRYGKYSSDPGSNFYASSGDASRGRKPSINSTGGSQSHTHGASASIGETDAHTHSIDTTPPFYTVVFIQYRGV